MHQVWFVAELQQIILSNCTSGSLSALARTSKYLKDPALNQLWGHREINLQQLLQLLPPEIETSNVGSDHKQRDVAPFSNYAKRVTRLRSFSDIRLHTIEALMQHLPTPICPNLRSLVWKVAFGDAECDFIIQLLGPHVDTIGLYNCARMDRRSALSLFSYISRCHASIEVFRTSPGPWVSFNDMPVHVNEAICATIIKLVTPSSILVSDPNSAAIAHIAASQTIQHLAFRYSTEEMIQSLLVDGPTQLTNLSSLSLHLTHCGISPVCHFIAIIPPERLRSFSLNITHFLDSPEIPPDQWRMLFQELAQRHSTMRTLSVMFRSSGSSCPLHSVLDFLLAMRNLTDVEWNSKIDGLSDDKVEAMALAWPNLRRLVLHSRVTLAGFSTLEIHLPELRQLHIFLDTRVTTAEWSNYQLRATSSAWSHLRNLFVCHAAEVTLAGFACLVKRYPQLQDLRINLSLEVPSREWMDEFMRDGACNHNLTYLSLESSTLGDPGDVADFLFQIVPNLCMIVSLFENEMGEHLEIWEDVCDRLSDLRRASGRAGTVSHVWSIAADHPILVSSPTSRQGLSTPLPGHRRCSKILL